MNIYDAYAKKDIDIKNLRIRIKDLEKENKYRKNQIKELKKELKAKKELLRYYQKKS